MKVNSNYQVSETTANLIACYQMAANLFKGVNDFSTETGENVEKFNDIWYKLEREIESLIGGAIIENVANNEKENNLSVI